MACFDNYILVKGYCGSNTPSTNIYINEFLPGITLKAAANIAEDTVQTGVGLLNQCVSNAILRVKDDLVSSMLGTVRFNAAVSTGQYGYYQPDDFDDSTKYLSGTATGRGLKFELRNDCRLSAMYVKRVAVLGLTGGSFTLLVKDGVTSTSYAFTLTARTLTWVEVNQKIASDLLHITIADANFQPFDMDLNYSGTCGFCSNDCGGVSACDCNAGLNVWGWDGTNTGSKTYGLSPVVHVICDQDKFLCEISQLETVAQMIAFKAGIVFMQELISTSRLNYYTIYEEDMAREWITEWTKEYDMRKNALTPRLTKYLLTVDSCCIECDSSNWHYGLP